jgi:hypothetical protein
MMSGRTVKTRESSGWEPTRRELLGAAMAATFGLLHGVETGYGQSTQPTASRPAEPPRIQPPWWLQREARRSRVVDIRCGDVLHAKVVDPVTLGEMLDQAIQNLTDLRGVEDAWHAVLGSAERIVLKFNRVGARVLGTAEGLARLLVGRLVAAGYDPAKITLVETPSFLAEQLGTGRVASGWGSQVVVGGCPEQLAQYLLEADAIINVPFLKTHQIAGMSGCLKNLSHALIRHPARYHADGCSPYVGQVVGSQEVSSKLRLNLMNAIRLVVDRGPDAREEDIVSHGGLLLGFDPVAVDSIGLSILAMERRRLGLPASVEVRHLASAAQMGLGLWRPADIDRVALEAGM